MKKLMKKINKFYEMYALDTIVLTKDDMYDYDTLMTAYESIWLTMPRYEDDSKEYKWMLNLYGELGEYLYDDCSKSKSVTNSIVFKIFVCIFGVLCTGFFSALLVEYSADASLVSGLILSIVLTVGYGILAYQDIRGAH